MPTKSDCLAVVISDLHLCEQTPELNQRLLQLLADIQVPKLYILGDFFEVWYGDNILTEWAKPILTALKATVERGIDIYFQHGNRDFLVGKNFSKATGVQLLNKEEYLTTIGKHKIIFMHGDSLCTDDIQHQKYRKIVRNPLVLFFFKLLPNFIKFWLGKTLRNKSKISTKLKAPNITDVNQNAVRQCLARHNCKLLIHGHTHRPSLHKFDDCKRYVLGDWGDKSWWLELYANSIELKNAPITHDIVINGDEQ